jgi:hypothetical protein
MLKEYIVLILLHLLVIKESKSKEDAITMKEIWEGDTTFDDAIGNCAQRPSIKKKLFIGSPPVS